MVTRFQVVFVARQWLGARYQHEGRKKAAAADCLFPLAVCEELGIKDKFGVPLLGDDYKAYSPAPKDAFIHKEALRRLLPKSIHELKPGDLVVMRFGAPVPSHCGLIGEFRSPNYTTLTLIHCDGRKVVECGLDRHWKKRIVGAFALPGVE